MARPNHAASRTRALTLTLAALIAAPALAGDLNPPGGNIDQTMKPLDHVEPRVVLNDLPGDASAVHVISEPGHYYLTANIVVPAGRSATVVDLAADPADDPVIIDLNGYSILGEAGSLDGVRFTSNFENGRYVLRAGVPLRFNTSSAIAGMGGHAVSYSGSPALIDGAAPVVISGLSVSNCGGDAVHVENAKGTYVFDLTVTDNIGLATLVSGNGRSVVIENASATNCLAGGAQISNRADVRVEKFSARNCGGPGLQVQARQGEYLGIELENVRVTSCAGPGAVVLDASQSVGAAIRVTDATLTDNASHAILVTGDNLLSPVPGEPVGGINVSLEQIVGMTNGGDGVHVELDASARPRVHCTSSTLRENAGHGLYCIGSTNLTWSDIRVKDSDASRNGGSGLHVSGNLTVSGATLCHNGADGLFHTTPGEPVGGINVSLEQITGSNNQGSGVRFQWEQLSGPVTLRVADTTCSNNDEFGSWIDDDSDNDSICEFDSCVAAGNALGGFRAEHPAPTTTRLYRYRKKYTEAHANGGNGFDIQNAHCEMEHCAASGNNGDGFAVVGEAFILDHCNSQDNTDDGVHFTASGPTEHQFANLIDSSLCRNGGHGANVESITTEDLLIDCREMTCSGNAGDGLHCAAGPSSGGAISIESSDMSSNDGAGVAATCPPDMPVKCPELTCNSNGAGGLVVSTGGSLVISGGSYCNNTGSGASLEVAGSLTVSDATMADNTGHGLVHASASGIPAAAVHVDHCVCSNNTLSGISVADSAGGRVQHCSAFSNGTSGIEVLSLTHVITNNMCANNTTNLAVMLPGNTLGPSQDELSAPTTDNASNYIP